MSKLSVEDVVKRNKAKLMTLEGVVDVEVGTAIPGYEAGKPSVTVYVRELGPSLQEALPESLEGFKLRPVIKAVEDNVEVYFSPKGGCAKELASEIDQAEKSVHCAIFSFTLSQVAGALVRAKGRENDVKVVFDRHQISQKNVQEIYERLRGAGVEVVKSANKALMHNKYAVVDGKTVVTGSFNWTTSAEKRNNENLVAIHLPKIAEAFEHNYTHLWNWHIEYYARAKVKFTKKTLVFFKRPISS